MTTLEDFYAGTRRAESGGNPNAQNPRSSARGLFQWTDGTWAGVVRNYGQRYGITPDGRGNPEQEDRAIRAITENEYVPAIQRAGRSVTPQEIYNVHFLGGDAYRRLTSADPSTPASEALNGARIGWNQVYEANQRMFPNGAGSTAGDVLAAAPAYWSRVNRGGPTKPVPPKAQEVKAVPVYSVEAPRVEVSSTTPTSSLWARIKSIFQRWI